MGGDLYALYVQTTDSGEESDTEQGKYFAAAASAIRPHVHQLPESLSCHAIQFPVCTGQIVISASIKVTALP